MQTWILWLFALYGLTAFMIQLYQWFRYPHQKKAVHYYLFTQNSQTNVEWMIRSLSQLARLEGRPFYIYIIDTGSVDDTLKIVRKLIRSGMDIQFVEEAPLDKNELQDQLNVLIDLRERCYACEFRTT